MRIFKLSIVFVLVFGLTVYADNFGNLKQYFAKEEMPQNILIISGYAHLNFIGGFADGKYRLKSYSIQPYAKNIYILNTVFEKKKHFFRYIQKFSLPFFYNGKIIAFKTIKGKKVYRFKNQDIEILHIKNGWRIVKHKGVLKIQLPVRSGYLLLIIRKP